ncbi:hypothetical protein [Novacetimonas sp. GS1]|uniref:hypothetical protein n=1 Tax=Novacetimonas sp. GS1 TaxID=3119990 RepID=UPI002FCCD7CC
MEAVIDAIGIPIQPCADVETVYRLPVLEADEIRPGVSSLVFRQGAELVRRTDMDVQIAARDAEITRLRVVEAEMHLLEEVCAFYANDEDRFIKSDGNAEPYGMIPTDVGMKARSARARFMAREQAAQNTGGQA